MLPVCVISRLRCQRSFSEWETSFRFQLGDPEEAAAIPAHCGDEELPHGELPQTRRERLDCRIEPLSQWCIFSETGVMKRQRKRHQRPGNSMK